MKAQNVQSKIKVLVQCPNGHELFKTGITLANLYKTYAVRVDESQRIREGIDWEVVFTKMCMLTGREIDRASFEKGKNKDIDLCPMYKVAPGQMKLLPACTECAKIKEV